jgi:alkanesulfonate monooxygenase SsuD/methylene tetrahydromethanopterin reductase-like flavin-dependent oxidoreductase (luciferase family)
MIGGGGERKTLRLVAQYADACNISATTDVGHKLGVLREHCDAVGRDYDDIEKTAMIGIGPDATVETVSTEMQRLAGHGFTATYVFAIGYPEPGRVVELLSGVRERLS